jgi:hypothetical protein
MSSPETGASTVRVMYCLAISAARVSIGIANPCFVPDHITIVCSGCHEAACRVRVMVAGVSSDTLVTLQRRASRRAPRCGRRVVKPLR